MNQDTIDIRGLFKNNQSIGFSLLNCLCEKIDNSISAGATNIKFTVDTITNCLTVSDDGHGMNIDGLHNCGKFSRSTEATATKHGRFGAGGNIADINITDMGKVHYISKPKDETNIYEMTLNYNVVKLEDYKLNPHEASRKTEELWQKYAADQQCSGTAQIMYSTAKIIKEIIAGLEIVDITGDRFKLGCTYYEQLQRGLKLSFQINESLYPIEAIDRFKYATIPNKDHKQKVTIRAYQLANSSSYRFYYSDANGAYYYRVFNQSNRGKTIKEVPEKTPHTHIGDIIMTSTYYKDWTELTKPDLDKMQLKPGIPQDKVKALLGGINVFRNEKLLAQFPSSHTGDSAGDIPYLQNSHHMIAFKANDQMDKFFEVLVNKSNLVEKNIQKELLNTIGFICNGFARKMKRIHEIVCDTCKSKDKCVCPLPVPVVVCQKCKAADKCVCKLPVPPPVPVVVCQKCKAADKCVCNLPPVKPIIPELNHAVNFSKTDTHLLISHQEKNIFKIPYVGQYNITEKYLNEILMKLGEKRFMEWIEKSVERGVFEHNQTYFN